MKEKLTDWSSDSPHNKENMKSTTVFNQIPAFISKSNNHFRGEKNHSSASVIIILKR